MLYVLNQSLDRCQDLIWGYYVSFLEFTFEKNLFRYYYYINNLVF